MSYFWRICGTAGIAAFSSGATMTYYGHQWSFVGVNAPWWVYALLAVTGVFVEAAE